jgi:hypothetical protein
MAEDWSRAEVKATVASYVRMLKMELSGQSYSKAEHNQALQRLLKNRSRGAIEYKFGNVSTVLKDFRLPYVKGYKPHVNYQALLIDALRIRLGARPALWRLILIALAEAAARRRRSRQRRRRASTRRSRRR